MMGGNPLPFRFAAFAGDFQSFPIAAAILRRGCGSGRSRRGREMGACKAVARGEQGGRKGGFPVAAVAAASPSGNRWGRGWPLAARIPSPPCRIPSPPDGLAGERRHGRRRMGRGTSPPGRDAGCVALPGFRRPPFAPSLAPWGADAAGDGRRQGGRESAPHGRRGTAKRGRHGRHVAGGAGREDGEALADAAGDGLPGRFPDAVGGWDGDGLADGERLASLSRPGQSGGIRAARRHGRHRRRRAWRAKLKIRAF